MMWPQDDVIVVNNLDGVDVGALVDMAKVLMIGSKKGTVIGHPYVTGAKVHTYRITNTL
jgi:ribosomal protein L21